MFLKEKKLAGGEKLLLVADPGLVINVFNNFNSKMGTCMINTLKSVCGKVVEGGTVKKLWSQVVASLAQVT